MSQDLVRQAPRNGNDPMSQMMASGLDPWGNPASSTAMTPAVGGDSQPLQILHRSLRGRYHWAFLLGAVGAVVGAGLGWSSYSQKYRAIGWVTISPTYASFFERQEQVGLYGNYMTSEASRIRSNDVVQAAITQPIWKEYQDARERKGRARLSDEAAKAVIGSGLSAQYDGKGTNLEVRVDAGEPDLARAAAGAVVWAYKDRRAIDIATSGVEPIQRMEQKLQDIDAEIQALEVRASTMVRIDAELTARRSLLGTVEQQYSQGDLDLARMVMAKAQVKKDAEAHPDTVTDPFLVQLLDEERKLQFSLDQAVGQGPNSPTVRNLKARLASIQTTIRAHRQQLRESGVQFKMGPDGKPIPISESDVEFQRNWVTTLLARKQALEKEVDDLEAERASAAAAMSRVGFLKDQRTNVSRTIEADAIRAIGLGASAQPREPAAAGVFEDRRPTMATFGFVAGGALPVLAVFVWGLADRKYRYSDEATTGSTRGIPLLGILPNLPDRLSDPSQASVAAHCVHQIRTMLQLNVIGEDPAILTVTSATSGDGKTSLTLALGLSFAASGSRTLLIDTDIIGGGLSSRLGIREPSGITEAILDRNPMSFIRETDVAELSVLPVGIGPNQQAGVFTPAAVRRLFAEVRKHYDIILVDTGPVLGSIEATPLVAAADATILTVAKGQNRDLVEKAITHLRQIGARLAGVVFNRAGTRDFERSISGISLRSVSRQQSAHHSNGHANSPNPVVSALSGRN